MFESAETTEGLVLVVGRDDAAIGFVAALLERHGIDANPVASVRAATEANAQAPQLVVVDRDLDAVRSIRALADVKRAGVDLVVLGNDPAVAGEEASAIEAGATHYVTRPVTEDTLVRGVRSILGDG